MVVKIIIKEIKLNKDMQRNLLILTFTFTILIIFLFNLYWAPMVFLIYTTYIILNRDKKISRKEIYGLILVKIFLFYCIIARMYGMGPGLLASLIVLAIALAVTKTSIIVKGGKK